MHTHTFPETTSIESESPASESKPAWWKKYVSNVGSRMHFGSRNRLIEEIREEQRQLVSALDKISERLETEKTVSPAGEGIMRIDPMPVMRSIEGIVAGQKELSAGIAQHLQRCGQTEERVVQAVTRVDRTLEGVRSCQADTVSAVGQVGEKMDGVAERFESLFSKMQEAEEKIAADYRKLQNRTLMAVGGIGATVIVALGVFLANS